MNTSELIVTVSVFLLLTMIYSPILIVRVGLGLGCLSGVATAIVSILAARTVGNLLRRWEKSMENQK